MPVGAPPPQTKLDQLRPQLEAMLSTPARRCGANGRVLGKQQPDGTVKPVDKLGGYSIRPLAYWAEMGCYPDRPIPKCPHDPFCVDCGRSVLVGDAQPEPAPIAPVGQVPPPPPVPAPAPGVGVAVERVEAGPHELRSCALVPVPVPAVVPRRPRVPAAAARRLLPVGVLLAFGVLLVVLVQGLVTWVSPLEDELPQGDAVVVTVATIPGQ